VTVASLAIVLAAVGAYLLLGSGGTTSSTTAPRPTPSKAAPRLAFAFKVDAVNAISLGRRSATEQAKEAAGAIAERLSTFYDHAFADPVAWRTGVPDDAWKVFAASVRERAKADADSFTPATTGVNLAGLIVSKSKLSVTVLFDNSGHPQAAFADVVFKGTGELKGGQEVDVENAVTFYMRPLSGTWVIVGYPQAETNVEAGSGASPQASASTSPSPGSSP
jgi:hypothetical protein